MNKKRMTFADAKKRIKELETQLDTSDNIYTSEENEKIKRSLKRLKVYKAGFWTLLSLSLIKLIYHLITL